MQTSNNRSQKSRSNTHQLGTNQGNETAGAKQMQGKDAGTPRTEISGTDRPGPSGHNQLPPDNADTTTVAVEKRDREAFEKAFGARGRESNVVHSGELPESQDRSGEQQG